MGDRLHEGVRSGPETGRVYLLRSWIRFWGPDIKVLAPDELKDFVRGDIKQMSTISGIQGS